MDIYDEMEDGEVQRAHNKRRLAELQASSADRQARITQVILLAQVPLTPRFL